MSCRRLQDGLAGAEAPGCILFFLRLLYIHFKVTIFFVTLLVWSRCFLLVWCLLWGGLYTRVFMRSCPDGGRNLIDASGRAYILDKLLLLLVWHLLKQCWFDQLRSHLNRWLTWCRLLYNSDCSHSSSVCWSSSLMSVETWRLFLPSVSKAAAVRVHVWRACHSCVEAFLSSWWLRESTCGICRCICMRSIPTLRTTAVLTRCPSLHLADVVVLAGDWRLRWVAEGWWIACPHPLCARLLFGNQATLLHRLLDLVCVIAVIGSHPSSLRLLLPNCLQPEHYYLGFIIVSLQLQSFYLALNDLPLFLLSSHFLSQRTVLPSESEHLTLVSSLGNLLLLFQGLVLPQEIADLLLQCAHDLLRAHLCLSWLPQLLDLLLKNWDLCLQYLPFHFPFIKLFLHHFLRWPLPFIQLLVLLVEWLLRCSWRQGKLLLRWFTRRDGSELLVWVQIWVILVFVWLFVQIYVCMFYPTTDFGDPRLQSRLFRLPMVLVVMPLHLLNCLEEVAHLFARWLV